jgi:GxxExxY protein
MGMTPGRLIEEELSASVINAFFDVYNTLGFGFLEHLYVMALERELRARGHRVGRQVGIRVMYKGEMLGMQRLDLIVDDKLVVETKSTVKLLEVGLLLHFGPAPKFYRVLSRNR